MKRAIAVLALLLCCASLMAQNHTVNLSITDTTNPIGTKHYIYHRVLGGTYSAADRKDVGTATTYAWVFTAMALGTHQFVSTAYAPDGTATVESTYSNEVAWVNAPSPPTLSITSVASNPFFKGATLTAQTNVRADTIIEFGEGAQLNVRRAVDTDRTDHSVTLDRLKPHRTYSYRWTAVAEDGTTVQSAVQTFTTM